MAGGLGLTAPQLIVCERVVVDELPVLPSVIESVDEESVAAETAPVAAPDFPRSSAAHTPQQSSIPEERVGTIERAAVSQELIKEVLAMVGCWMTPMAGTSVSLALRSEMSEESGGIGVAAGA